jgi:hypothetical protein
MKQSVLFLIALMSTQLLAVTSTNSWKLKNNFTVSKVWQHTSDSSLYVSIEKTKIDDIAQYKSILNDKTKLAALEEEKKATLGLIGVKNWNAPTKAWTKVNGRDFLHLQGTYVDNSDETVFFKEYHLVENGNVLQILFTSTKKDSYTSQVDIEHFLKEVKMDVISE